ncbi:MAG: twin-arginine translocation signal domain-containing protein [Methanobacteriota archaeon]
MRELSERLYLTRREFLKGLVTVGVGAVAGTSGCVDYIDKHFVPYLGKYFPRKTPEPKKRFTPELRIEGDEEFKRNVENMLRVLKEYSPEWYEKTMYAGEVINPYEYVGSNPNGSIGFPVGFARLGGSEDIKQVLSVNARFPHEVQHVIDRNVYVKWSDIGELDRLESELRAGIASDIYEMEVSVKMPEYYDYLGSPQGYPSHFKTRNIVNEIYMWRFTRFKLQKEEVDQIKYKDRLDVIESMYFDHENKKLKTEFLDESWQEFKKEYL